MNDGSQFIDLVLFAMVAVFLGLRLRSVLGKRTGEEPPPERFRGGKPPAKDAPPNRDNVVDLEPNRPKTVSDLSADAPPPGSLAAGLAEVAKQDPSFNEAEFRQGAVAAFEMIVRAFADGDEETLRMLLADEVFENFAHALQERRQAGNVCENTLEKVLSVDFVQAGMEGRFARVTIKYVTEQVVVVKNAAGAVIEGDPSRSVEITDIWTFARDVGSRDPNWLLVATSSPEA